MDLQARLLARIYRKRDYMKTFTETPEGVRVLKHILSVAGATRPRFHSDPMQTAYNEGQRNLAMSIFRQVHSSMDKLPDYITEEMQRIEKEESETS